MTQRTKAETTAVRRATRVVPPALALHPCEGHAGPVTGKARFVP